MFDAKDEGLTEFEKNVQTLITSMPKEAKIVLRRVGTKARSIYVKKARQLVKKHTGYYHRKFKRGKVWDAGVGDYRVRVYNNSPHAHLLEDGHRIIGKDGSEHGFQPGYKVLEKGEREVEKEWDTILGTEIDKMMDKL